MNKTTLLVLVSFLLLLQVSQADDAFRISIVQGDHQDFKLAPGEQIQLPPKSPALDLDKLPVIVCTIDPKVNLFGHGDNDPANVFYVVIENTQDKETMLTMKNSNWWDCLSFQLVDDTGKTYSILHHERSWAGNGPETRTFSAHGSQNIPVNFRDGTWDGLPLGPKQPMVVQLTASFLYYPKGKPPDISSQPTDVILTGK